MLQLYGYLAVLGSVEETEYLAELSLHDGWSFRVGMQYVGKYADRHALCKCVSCVLELFVCACVTCVRACMSAHECVRFFCTHVSFVGVCSVYLKK